VLVVGAGPAGVAAALRAADLGAKTTLVTRDEFGGMAANDGPKRLATSDCHDRAQASESDSGLVRNP
jgi:pyruvate/2-oxoglutarate dehydrogenase complex dihydrolipoamide dehydrogenase (E3) component